MELPLLSVEGSPGDQAATETSRQAACQAHCSATRPCTQHCPSKLELVLLRTSSETKCACTHT
eukprot:352587-Chlamydomonas_euryale.AAC.6